MNLVSILRRHWKGVALALGLVGIENVAWIVEPGLFGPVLDALINRAAGSGSGAEVARTLSMWAGVFLVNSAVGAFRRSYDQRIYLRMFSVLAREVAETSQRRRMSASKTAARAELSREFVTFLQYRTPETIEQVIAIAGSLIGLALFDWRLTATSLVIMVPLGIIGFIYSRKMLQLEAILHDSVEETYDVFTREDPAGVERYYTERAAPQQRIADLSAVSFGLMRLSLLSIFVMVLFIAIDLDEFTTGNIYTIVAYIWTFVTSSEYIPELMESWASLKEIDTRLRTETA